MLSETTESGPDENGYYTRVEYRINEKNNKVKVITRFKKCSYNVKLYSSAIERQKNWNKFGAALDNTGVTSLSNELVFMEPPPKNNNLVKNTNIFTNFRQDEVIICKKCNGPHWTRVCDCTDSGEKKEENKEEEKKYHKKDEKFKKEKVNNLTKNTVVQVINLGKNVDESDILDLFSQTGFVKRVSIVKDYETQESKGLGYVLFDNETDAKNTVNTFNNRGFNHLILNLKIVH